MWRGFRSVALVGYYGFGNLGDELILDSALRELARFGTEIHLLASTKAFERYKLIYSEYISQGILKLYDRWDPLQIVKALDRAEAIVYGGGGLFQDETSLRSLIYYITIGYSARVLKKALILERQSIGPLKRSLSRWLFRNFLKYVDYISVRDRMSLNYLESFGIKAELKDDWLLDSFSYPLNYKVSGDKKRILWIFRNWQVKPDVASLLRETVRSLKGHSDVVVFQEGDSKAVKGYLIPEDVPVYTFRYVDELNGLLAMMNNSLVISMRLHGIILAFKLHRPIIALSYSPKVKAFCEDKGIKWFELSDIESVKSFSEELTHKIINF